MLYRVLVGPFDQSKSDEAGLLGSQHELSKWRNRNFFRDRVADGAADATVEADVAFGKSVITVRRSLSSLEIVFLSEGGKQLDASQEAYEDAVLRLSGSATYFDFFAILRYLVFYLEDRVELIWDKRSQFDMMRVLLFDRQAAKSAAEAYDEAQAADSQYRNRRAIVNKDKDRLATLELEAGRAEASEYRMLQLALAEANARDMAQAEKIEDVRSDIDAARLRREKSLLDLQEAKTAVEFEEQAHYSHLFPHMGDAAKYVFLNLLGGGGCLVCGNVSSDAATYLRQKLEENHCPICDSAEPQQERVVSSPQFSRARLQRAKVKVDKLREAVAFATGEIEELETRYQDLVFRREEDLTERQKIRDQILQYGPIEVADDTVLESLRASVDEGEKRMRELIADRTTAEGRYGRIVNKQKAAIEATTDNIRKRFRYYAGLVLAERCELSIANESRPIGQEGKKFDFPYFEPMMTSSIFDQSPSSRANSDAVSESQREFLDIAFRLALIDAVTGGKADSMLVLETPESSLDSLFVAKAGEAFRHYAENPARKNILIASTNLNNEEMLSALLGTKPVPKREKTASSQVKFGRQRQFEGAPAPKVPLSERPTRIINLLELAAPSAALRQYRAYYKRLFNRALGR